MIPLEVIVSICWIVHVRIMMRNMLPVLLWRL